MHCLEKAFLGDTLLQLSSFFSGGFYFVERVCACKQIDNSLFCQKCAELACLRVEYCFFFSMCDGIIARNPMVS